MKLVFRTFIILFVSVFVFNSCKNDLKLNAPYQEIPSIYAVLNPQDKIQMIRINKIFLGEGNANAMAQVADSINYPEGELEVTLKRTAFGASAAASWAPVANEQVITFKDSMVQAQDGAFNKSQRVYVTSHRLFVNGNYVLTVKNKKTGNVFTANANAIDSIKGNLKPLTTTPVYPYPLNTSPNEYIDYASNDGATIRFAPNEGILYHMVIRMHFYDSLAATPVQKIYRYVDYEFGNQNVKDVQVVGGNSFITTSFKKADLFSAAGYNLAKLNLDVSQAVVGRKMYKIEYLIYSTTQEYLDYTQYVSPSFSINQNKPLYSNFDNKAALGLFTFRSRYSINKAMATFFISEFAYNSNTCAYKFLTATGSLPGCNY